MRLITTLLLATTLLLFSGCAKESDNEDASEQSAGSSRPPAIVSEQSRQAGQLDKRSGGSEAKMETVSLTDAQTSQQNMSATERKIIRNAEMTLETDTPSEGQRKIAAIAEAHGGFVVTSDARQNQTSRDTKPEMIVTVVARVPATQFNAALDEIRALGNRVQQEKITGQDVTEEYLDLEARLRAKQALEAQFLEIMKQAKSVTDALEVQRQLSDVRAEIERLEGRRRFLENQSSLSTITVTLQPSQPLVNTSGFFYKVKRAFGSGVDIAAAITLFLIQFIVAMIPILLLIFLPIILLLRYLLRRWRRARLALKLAQEQQQPVSEET
jgi:hypothetical protein